MIRRTHWLALVLTAYLMPGGALRAQDASHDLSGLFGTWTAQDPDGTESVWTFDGDHLKVTSPKRNYVVTLKLDSSSTPKKVDFKVTDGPEDAKGKTALAIYRFDNVEHLTICMGGKEDKRPEEFEAKKDESYLFKLKRKQATAESASKPNVSEYHLTGFFGLWTAKDPDGTESRWEFNGREVKVTSPKRDYTATVSVDPSADPHAIDFNVEKGPKDSKGKTALGIYKLEGSTLTICLGEKDNVRPKKFKAEKGESILFELKRRNSGSPDEDPAMKTAVAQHDFSGMYGTWKGKDPEDNEIRWEFNGKDLKVTSSEHEYTATVSIDPSATPKTIDFKVEKGPKEMKGKTALGIYKLDNTNLTICVNWKDNTRPKEFKAEKDKGILFELKR